MNAASPQTDAEWFAARRASLESAASGTDGLAMLSSNDLARSFKQIIGDLSSYYLLGYYSTGKLDGTFHAITVRIKRPGVQVRARRGYLASPPRAAVAKTSESKPEMTAVATAIAGLAAFDRESALRIQIAVGWKAGTPPAATVWVEGELSAAPEFREQSQARAGTEGAGTVATIEIASADGRAIGATRVALDRGTKSFRVALPLASVQASTSATTQPIGPGNYVMRVTLTPANGASPIRETATVVVRPHPATTGAIWWRRGQSTGNRELPAADLRFRRSEQLRVDIPTTATPPRTSSPRWWIETASRCRFRCRPHLGRTPTDRAGSVSR